jgi:hypothetical protein
MKPIDMQQIQGPVQVLLTVLSDENGSTPNHLLEGVVSGKSLLRAILQGNVVVCQAENAAPPAPTPAIAPEEVSEKEDGAEAA